MSERSTEEFVIHVGISKLFGRKSFLPARGRSDYRSVRVNKQTTVDHLKRVVLQHLGYPFPDFFSVMMKGKNVVDSDTISNLNMKPNDSSLEIVCTNLESLYSELRRAGKL